MNFFFRFPLFFLTLSLLLPTAAQALTVGDVVRDLACPCECPLILEDCNMSCGLDWKNQVGEMINQGKNKQEIMDYFYDKYGESAHLTTMQRIDGKIFQYTRGFGNQEWLLLWSGLGLWTLIMFLGIMLGVRKFISRNSPT